MARQLAVDDGGATSAAASRPGAIDPRELAEAFLDRHRRPTPTARASTPAPRPDRARAEARRRRAPAPRPGLRRGPLDGVPLAWKDLFDTAGIATEAGTALMAGRVPDRDAAVLATRHPRRASSASARPT